MNKRRPRTVETDSSPYPVLLGFLMVGPRHPYDLNREFSRDLGRVWHIGKSHIYAHLKRLAAEGLASVATEAGVHRPGRQVYRITPEGRKFFFDWLDRPASHVRLVRLEFPARFYFYKLLDLPDLPRLISSQREELLSRRSSLDEAVEADGDAFWRLVVDFRRSEIEAIIGWLDRCLERSAR
jgi:PadR family transcriptional regulator, regulatory protein AphA